ncbi:MAG: T9SS type A sorting domain-containing protein, partial [Ignavibacteriaceae bacterium]|nr:T9SS type A sorting domain-containing protein [Ignavibacteriaceae bacterium]
YEGDTSPEIYYCYAGQTIDGPWILLGTGNGTTQFDLSTSGLANAQFFKIVDDGDGTANVPDAGFDLDAIETTAIIPVEFVSFTAESDEDKVLLKWQTATEINNSGFEVERSHESGIGSQKNWENITFVEGSGTTTEVQQYSYSDRIEKPGSYYYRLKQIDFDGTVTYSPVVEVDVTGPKEFALFQNYPNPFNPSTSIKFALPKQTEVKLVIYNALGQVVAELINESMEEGFHQIQFAAGDLASGIYYYRLKTSKYSSIKKMLLLK